MVANRAFLTAATRRHRLRGSLPSPSAAGGPGIIRRCTDEEPRRSSTAAASAGVAASSRRRAPPLRAPPSLFRVRPTTRTFSISTADRRETPSKKNKKGNGKQPDAYKRQLKAHQSIIGRRPGQTSFSPPKDKVLSRTPPKPATTQTGKAADAPRSLIVPSVPRTTDRRPSSTRDNKDHAHTHPSASAITSLGANDGDDGDDNPLRDLFLRQGILPPPPRPEFRRNELGVGPVSIPEPDPSGVSGANPEDILDLASMYEPSVHLPDKPDFASRSGRAKYEAGTPMTDELIAYIGVRGPITTAEYMRRALRDGRFGYYTGKGSRDGKREAAPVEAAAVGDAVGAADAAVDEQTEVEDDNDWDLDDHERDIHTDGNSAQHAGGEHVIGSGGDFITAPEVSQLFGESLLVWIMTQYQTLGSPSKIQIVEIGPGKGTLICDMVRSAVDTFPDFAAALTAATDGRGKKKEKVAVGVHLVEVTNGMRARQKESLQNLEKENSMKEKGYSFRFPDDDDGGIDEEEDPKQQPSAADESNSSSSSSGAGADDEKQICFSWHDVLSSVPTHDAATGEPVPTFVICQELVDALPIHSFQKVEGGVWRERLVDVAVRDEEEARDAGEEIKAVARRYASAEDADDAASAPAAPPSPAPSPAPSPSSPPEGGAKKIPRLRFVLPPDTTPALRTVLRVDSRGSPVEDDNPAAHSLNALPVGSIVEACPEALLLVQDVASRIGRCGGGAALIVDYGGDGSSGGDTLRGFWRHAQVHPLSRPGEADVTADVDFGALREAVNSRMGTEESLERKLRREQGRKFGAAKSSEKPTDDAAEDDESKAAAGRKVEAFGPISQGKFLAQMGMVQRVESKLQDPETTDEQAEEIYAAMERLMATEQMGERYKVLAIAAKKEGLFPPPGF